MTHYLHHENFDTSYRVRNLADKWQDLFNDEGKRLMKSIGLTAWYIFR